MRVVCLALRDFRSYAAAEVALAPGLTVVAGPNGAGKTNLLEALYFGCTGRSCRTANEREVVAFGAAVTRVEVETEDPEGHRHRLGVGFRPGEPKRTEADGAAVERMQDVAVRPLVSVFLPDRLELVKGTPSGRRAHLDQVVAALWPARVVNRRGYHRALAQRNALLARVRAGVASSASLPTWDAELARHGWALMEDRRATAELLAPVFAERAGALGLPGTATLVYRPRFKGEGAAALAEELAGRTDGDLARGFTEHGPHRDDLALLRDGRELRTYGSQGQQRVGLLALLLAEREAIGATRGARPLLLLDDVMSELDAERRERLVALVAGGQTVITTTEWEHVPTPAGAGVHRLSVGEGAVLAEALAA